MMMTITVVVVVAAAAVALTTPYTVVEAAPFRSSSSSSSSGSSSHDGTARAEWKPVYPCPAVQNIPADVTAQIVSNINWTFPGMQPAKQHYDNGNLTAALLAVDDFISQSNLGWWLRVAPVPPTNATVNGSVADALNDTYTFYGVRAHVDRLSDQGLDWHYKGPQHDNEYMYALNRHAIFPSLVQAYQTTGNTMYSGLLASLICDWVAHNTPPPADPSKTTGTWRTLEAGIRMSGEWPTALFAAFNMSKTAPALVAARLFALSTAVQHGKYLDKYGGQGNANWRSMQYHGLATTAVLYPMFNHSDDWYTFSSDGVKDDMKSGVYPDGVETEQTSAYHKVATDNFQAFYNVSVLGNKTVDLTIYSTLEAMHNYLAFCIDQHGINPINSDSDTENLTSYLIDAAAIFNRSDWVYIATAGEQGTEPHLGPTIIFPWSGQIIARSGWTRSDQWLWMDLGPYGSSSHGHHDKLHISFRAYGEHYLVDSGRFAYSGEIADKFRNSYAVSTRGHNTIMIDEKDQVASPTVASSPVPTQSYSIGETMDWAYGNITFEVDGKAAHTRGMTYMKHKFVLVVDRVETDKPRKIQSFWHCFPGRNVTYDQTKATVEIDGDQGGLLLVPIYDSKLFSRWSNISVVQGQMEPHPQGWYSPVYDSYSASPAVVAELTQTKADTHWSAWAFAHSPNGASEIQLDVSLASWNASTVTFNVAFQGQHFSNVPVRLG